MAKEPEQKQETEVKTEEPVVEQPTETELVGNLPQFKAPSIEDYSRNIEKAYSESSKEAVRLNRELEERNKELEVIKNLVGSDADLKNKLTEKLYAGDYSSDLFDDEGRLNKAVLTETIRQVLKEETPNIVTSNPTIQNLEKEKRARDKAIYDEFEKAHPELATNEELSNELEINFGAIASTTAGKGLPVDFEKTLNKAWKITTGEKASGDAELEGMKIMAQKQEATTSGIGTSPKASGPTRSLTEAERSIAQKLGLSDEDYLEGKKLSEKAKENY